MMDLIVFFLAAFGFAFIVGHSKISLAPRIFIGGLPTPQVVPGGNLVDVKGHVPGGKSIVDLLECPGCLGFHLGWIGGLFLHVGAGQGIHWLMLAFATSGVNFILGRLTNLI